MLPKLPSMHPVSSPPRRIRHASESSWIAFSIKSTKAEHTCSLRSVSSPPRQNAHALNTFLVGFNITPTKVEQPCPQHTLGYIQHQAMLTCCGAPVAQPAGRHLRFQMHAAPQRGAVENVSTVELVFQSWWYWWCLFWNLVLFHTAWQYLVFAMRHTPPLPRPGPQMPAARPSWLWGEVEESTGVVVMMLSGVCHQDCAAWQCSMKMV